MPLIKKRVFPLSQTPVAAINVGKLRALICEDLDLAKRVPQHVTVIRDARKAAHTNHEVFVQRSGHADLEAKLLADPGRALRDAIHFWLVRGVNLVAPILGW